jgi:hypothetical protein
VESCRLRIVSPALPISLPTMLAGMSRTSMGPCRSGRGWTREGELGVGRAAGVAAAAALPKPEGMAGQAAL